MAMAGWLEQQVLCYLLALPWDLEKVCVHYLKAERQFLHSSRSSDCKPGWFSNPVKGSHLPSTGP